MPAQPRKLADALQPNTPPASKSDLALRCLDQPLIFLLLLQHRNRLLLRILGAVSQNPANGEKTAYRLVALDRNREACAVQCDLETPGHAMTANYVCTRKTFLLSR